MKILNSSLIAATLAASFAASAAVPLNAAPMFVPQAAPLVAGVEMAAYEEAWKPMKPWLGNTMTTGSIKARHAWSAAHVAWCESHYITYRPADNTYAPPRGTRRECLGPNA